MKRSTIGLEQLEINADIFVIPNSLITVKEMEEYRPKMATYVKFINELNHLGIKDIYDERMVEVWLTSKKDTNSDNLGDHGINFINIRGYEVHADTHFLNRLPLTMLKDKREGEIFEITVPLNINNCWDFEHPDVLLSINATCKQKEYRYSSYGKFENAIEMVM